MYKCSRLMFLILVSFISAVLMFKQHTHLYVLTGSFNVHQCTLQSLFIQKSDFISVILYIVVVVSMYFND